MQEKPKQNEQTCGDDPKKHDKREVSETGRSYYYDDAHGYEVFVDTGDDADDDVDDQMPAG